VVEVDAVLDGRRHETEHALPLVQDGVAIAGRLAGQAEVDAEPRPQSLDMGLDAMPHEQVVEPLTQFAGHGVDVDVEAEIAVRRHRRYAGGDTDRMYVVVSGVLADADRHEPVHALLPAAEYAQRIPAADGLAQGAEIGRDAEILLCSARAHAEGAEHLIKDE